MLGLLCALVSSACVTTPGPFLSQDTDNVTFDLSSWMSDLPVELHKLPLNHLAIPGSHDSFTAGLEEGDMAPDFPESLDSACYLLGHMCKDLVYHWARTQTLDFSQQLQAGIRYMDLRISAKEDTEELFFSHGLYGHRVQPALLDVRRFLDSHPREVVILDVNHFYGVTRKQHKQLLDLLAHMFRGKLCPRQPDKQVTLENLWKNQQQVIVIYHSGSATHRSEFWRKQDILSLWADTDDLDSLLEFLDTNYKEGHPDRGFHVTQGILTPFAEEVIGHPTGSLRTTLSVPAAPTIVSWLENKRPGLNGLNICIMDFVEEADYIPTVVALNTKLLGTNNEQSGHGTLEILEQLQELKHRD